MSASHRHRAPRRRFAPVGGPEPKTSSRIAPGATISAQAIPGVPPKTALGGIPARPSWWRLPTGARRMLRIFSQFSLPPGRATNSRLFPFPQHCGLRFIGLIPRREVATTKHHSDERSASLDSPFSLLWNYRSRSSEYAPRQSPRSPPPPRPRHHLHIEPPDRAGKRIYQVSYAVHKREI